MGGGLLQIVAYGSQDIYLTGNPQITFFKAVYRRHTNFSMESIKQTINGTADFGEEVNVTLQRNADLVHKMYIQVKLPSIDISDGNGTNSDNSNFRAFRWLNWIGHVLIKDVEISIGGQKIDKHYGEWLHIWNELSQSSGKTGGYAEMVGNVPKLTQIYSSNTTSSTENKSPEYTLYIPLQFWFCRNPGMALPLIALQYSDINININFRDLNDCIWANKQTSTSLSTTYNASSGKDVFSTLPKISKNTNVYADYIYLDTDERRRFSQVPHEYLIEQLQFNGNDTLSSLTNNIKLNFTHPVKEIIWVVQPTNYRSNGYSQSRAGKQYFNYTDLWDYSGFTGTPEPSSGPGMVGGKNIQNLWYGLPNVQLQGSLKYNKNTWNRSTTSYTNQNAGYTDIKDYTKTNGVVNVDNSVGLWSLNNEVALLDGGNNCISKAKIVLNGNDRISEREGKYFNLVQPYQHHTTCPAPGINVYSFALKPEDHQPSGTCNFSRIDNAHLNITVTDKTIGTTYNSGSAYIKIYAINYNILRIMSGMGGLAYSN